MVENVTDDSIEPKPAIIEASGDVKPTVNVKLKVKIPFQSHIEEKPKSIISFCRCSSYSLSILHRHIFWWPVM